MPDVILKNLPFLLAGLRLTVEIALLSIAGVVLGLAGVAAVTGAIRQLLYGVRPLDEVTLAGVVALVAVVAVCAAGVPAWRSELS